MTRFVVDRGVVLKLASEEFELPDTHELLAPTLLRSQTLSALQEAVHRREVPADVAEAPAADNLKSESARRRSRASLEAGRHAQSKQQAWRQARRRRRSK
jgi:hypothetical protein